MYYIDKIYKLPQSSRHFIGKGYSIFPYFLPSNVTLPPTRLKMKSISRHKKFGVICFSNKELVTFEGYITLFYEMVEYDQLPFI